MFMIGIDPHKGSHTAAAVDRSEAVIDTIRVEADRHQRARLLEWATRFEPRTWAVYQRLVADTPTLSDRLEFERADATGGFGRTTRGRL